MIKEINISRGKKSRSIEDRLAAVEKFQSILKWGGALLSILGFSAGGLLWFGYDRLKSQEVAVGKEIPHPNTVEHHIAWIALYYTAEGSQLPVELARANFAAHGPEVLTAPILKATVRLPKAGTLQAVAYCNLHGLWEGEVKVG